MLDHPTDNLPVWDLSDLYDGIDDPRIEASLAALEKRAQIFAEKGRGRLAAIPHEELAGLLNEYEEIEQGIGRLQSYGELRRASAQDDPVIARFDQDIRERCITIANHSVFFPLEMAALSAPRHQEILAVPALASRRWWFGKIQDWRAFHLDLKTETLLAEKSLTANALRRLYDETIAEMRFTVGKRRLLIEEAIHLQSDPSRAVRRKAAQAITLQFRRRQSLFALIHNTLAKDKAIEDTRRGFAGPVSARNLENQIEDEIVDVLSASVRGAYGRLSHRYYRIKARWFGLRKLSRWDRNAPAPDAGDTRIPWTRATEIVTGAYHSFDPEFGALAKRFLTQGWVDAAPRCGKATGAFSHPVTPDAHPKILLNYMESPRCVMTLAHELGHGIHQILAARAGWLGAQTPLTLAESASVFGEMLTFRALLDEIASPVARRALLAAKIEDALNTVVRQIAFHEFETGLHQERQAGEVAPERIGQLWMETQRDSLGPAIALDSAYEADWPIVPHFIHTPFYVYSYAFGECVANNLYAIWQGGEYDEFPVLYRKLLAGGGIRRYDEALAILGLDARDPGFWDKGLKLIEDMIDTFEPMIQL